MRKRRVVIGVLGTVLDKRGKARQPFFASGGQRLGCANKLKCPLIGWNYCISPVTSAWRSSSPKMWRWFRHRPKYIRML